jgi:hypothetical protein
LGCHQNAVVSHARDCKKERAKNAARVEELEENATGLGEGYWAYAPGEDNDEGRAPGNAATIC